MTDIETRRRTNITLDRRLVAKLDEWIEDQPVRVGRSAAIEAAIHLFLDSRRPGTEEQLAMSKNDILRAAVDAVHDTLDAHIAAVRPAALIEALGEIIQELPAEQRPALAEALKLRLDEYLSK